MIARFGSSGDATVAHGAARSLLAVAADAEARRRRRVDARRRRRRSSGVRTGLPAASTITSPSSRTLRGRGRRVDGLDERPAGLAVDVVARPARSATAAATSLRARHLGQASSRRSSNVEPGGSTACAGTSVAPSGRMNGSSRSSQRRAAHGDVDVVDRRRWPSARLLALDLDLAGDAAAPRSGR